MPRLPAPTPDRRADRRLRLTGHARLTGDDGGGEQFGGIVDVSARGVRLRVRPEVALPASGRCHVWLEVALPGSAPESPPVRLHGDAVVLRRSTADDRSEEVALRFREPLRVGEAFAAPATAVRPSPRALV